MEKRWGRANVAMYLLTSGKITRKEKSMYQAFRKEAVKAREESKGDGAHTTYALTVHTVLSHFFKGNS